MVFLLPASEKIFSQTVSIDLAGSSSAEFTFNTFNKLINGIVLPNVFTLNIDATGGQWDLYAGAITTIAGTWDNSTYYTTSGNGVIPVGLLQMRVHNLSNTPLISGYVALQDIATSTLDIIGNHTSAPDPTVNCGDLIPTGTNTPGTYTITPQCYQFKIDLKMVPGLVYRPGLYTMQIEFIIAEDL